MGLATKLHEGFKKYDPGTQIHRGINKALNIEPDFMAPGQQGLLERLSAKEKGDSQWQKFNPTNIRDFNERMGYNYKEGGRDPKAEISESPPPPGAPVAGGTKGTTAGAQPPPVSAQAPNPVSKIQKQFAAASQMRAGPMKRPRALGGR